MRALDRLLLALAVGGVALLARSSPSQPALAFAPRQDALEYVAGAQSIAQEGTYLLRVGPYRVRPRYPPGFPLLLAAALRTGVPPEGLWRVAAGIGAVMTALLALLAAGLAQALAPAGRGRLAAWLAGIVAGVTWAVSPVAIRVSVAVMSDGPAALAALGALLFLGAACLGESTRWRAGLAAAAGLLGGATAVMRPIAGVLLLLPLGVLTWAALRRLPLAQLARALAAAAAGAAAAPLCACLLLVHSGLPPMPWSGYRFWMPKQFSALRGPFKLSAALEGRAGVGPDNQPLSNLQLGARALLGLRGIKRAHQAGVLWPLLGWVGGAALWRMARRTPRWSQRAAPVGWAVLAWAAGHVLVFSLYVYSGGRFYLPVLAILAVLFGAGTGVALTRLTLPWRIGLGAVALLLPLVFAGGFGANPGAYAAPPLERALRNRVPRWLALDDATRAASPTPFDPVYAQALGLLGPEAVAGVREWGPLPRTWHVRQLVELGVIPAAETAPARPRDQARQHARGVQSAP